MSRIGVLAIQAWMESTTFLGNCSLPILPHGNVLLAHQGREPSRHRSLHQGWPFGPPLVGRPAKRALFWGRCVPRSIPFTRNIKNKAFFLYPGLGSGASRGYRLWAKSYEKLQNMSYRVD